jgi:hypothetical protein
MLLSIFHMFYGINLGAFVKYILYSVSDAASWKAGSFKSTQGMYQEKKRKLFLG